MCKYLQLGTTNLEKPSIYFLNYCKSKIYKKKFTEFQELNEEVRRPLSIFFVHGAAYYYKKNIKTSFYGYLKNKIIILFIKF